MPRLADLGRDTRVNLAVSLNATENQTRSRLMPINRRYPLEELLAACARYPLAPGRMITFEYILIEGINDGSDVHKTSAALRAMPVTFITQPSGARVPFRITRPPEGFNGLSS